MKREKACYYPKSGKLIVYATPDNHRMLKKILEEINETPRQVSIEAKFVEIEQTDLDTLGFEWSIEGGGVNGYDVGEGLAKSTGGHRGGWFQAGFGNQNIASNGKISNGMRFASDVFNQASLNDSIFSVYAVLGNYAFKTVIHALKQSKNSDVLSAPKVTTISGTTAQLKVVTQQYEATSWSEAEMDTNASETYTSTNYTPPVPTLESVELGVLLDVTPVVAPDAYSIYLEMMPQVTDLVGHDTTYNTHAIVNDNYIPMIFTMPIYSKREIKTQLVVYDNETVVMGGLLQEKLQRFEDKIPLLGDIPLLGRLFTSRGEQSVKTNLMMFVNVRLVKPDGQPLRANEIRGLPDFRH